MSRLAAHSIPLFVALSAFTLGGCSEDLDPASLVSDSRAVGIRYEVVGEPERASPRSGETVAVELFVADPGPRLHRTYLFVVCRPLATTFGVDVCDGAPFAVIEEATLPPPGAPFVAPRFELEVPAEEAFGEAEELLLLGALCSGGELAEVDFQSLREATSTVSACADPTYDGEFFSARLPVELSGQEANENPGLNTLGFGSLILDYEPADDAPASGCVPDCDLPDGPICTLSGEDPVELFIAALPGSRETFTALEGDPPEPVERMESLLISHLTTTGDMDRTFSFIEGDNPLAEVTWEPPPSSEVPDDGLLARFYFVMRDQRGGADFAERAVCVIRPDISASR